MIAQTTRLYALLRVPVSSFLNRTISHHNTVNRDEKYKKLDEDDLAYFRSFLHQSEMLQNKDDVEPYNIDWMRQFKGQSQLVLFPHDTHSLSKILSYCNEQRLAVVPQGGNTGLVGGGVPVFDEVIVSTKKMNRIIDYNERSGVVTCESGVILEELNNYVRDRGHIVPLDLGAKGSCTIGGNVSTNAGGIRFIRYGSLRGTVTGIEAVLPTGEIVDTLSAPRKDNTGLDMKQLFIGSEGAFGIVSAVSIQCAPLSSAVHTLLIGCSSYERVLKVFSFARKQLGEILSAFEFIDAPAFKISSEHNELNFEPLRLDHKFFVLVETMGSNRDHDYQKVMNFLEDIIDNDIVDDGILSKSESDVANMWKLRESIGEVLTKQGWVYKYDLSLSFEHFYKIAEELRERLPEEKAQVYGYGHLGDANLHLNIVSKEYSEEVHHIIEPWVYEYCKKHGGSVSAEHGLGQLKRNYAAYGKTNAHIRSLYQLKQLFDPNEILNPYKILPPKETILKN